MVYFSRFAREDIYMACFTLLLVVAVAQYMRTRRIVWFITAAVAFSLSYATNEATFLTIAVFGSFFRALVAWELGSRRSLTFRSSAKQLAINDGEENRERKSVEKSQCLVMLLPLLFSSISLCLVCLSSGFSVCSRICRSILLLIPIISKLQMLSLAS